MTSLDWDGLPNFSRSEFECRCGCGQADMDWEFLKWLQYLRSDLGFPFRINSGFRCETYNKSIGGGVPHPTGKAADIGVCGEQAYWIASKAEDYGFTGIGLMQHGAHSSRFLHLDTLASDDGVARPWVWTYL